MNRRQLLQGGAAGALALASTLTLPSAAKAAPRKALRQTTFVLVHGAWHNSLTWSRVVGPLSALGHRVVTLDLPGHGVNARFPASYFQTDREAMTTERSPSADLTLDDAADAVLETIRGLDGERVVLVGHSMAGHMLSRVAEREPSRIARLVYLTAFMPVNRPSFADYIALPEAKTEGGNAAMLGDPAKIGASRIDPRSPDAAYMSSIHKAFYGDVDEPTFRAFANGLTPDQPLHFFADSPGITRARWGKVPRSYIVCELDGALAPALQELFIREADALTPDNRTRVVRLRSSHSPFASQPQRLVQVLAEQASL